MLFSLEKVVTPKIRKHLVKNRIFQKIRNTFIFRIFFKFINTSYL